MLVARASGEGAVVLQLWSRAKLLRELTVPKAQHGAVYNDGWFSRGAAWSSDESRVVYVAEVGRRCLGGCCLGCCCLSCCLSCLPCLGRAGPGQAGPGWAGLGKLRPDPPP
jgi:hypothetical protein